MAETAAQTNFESVDLALQVVSALRLQVRRSQMIVGTDVVDQ